MVRGIIFSLAAFLRHDHRQAVFPAQPVADVAYAVIGALIGNVLVVVYKVDRAKNDMVMDMPLVNVRRKDVFMLPLCYRVGKLPPDLMGFFVIDFPRLKGLYQVVGEVVSLIQRLGQGIQASFAPFYTETILNETITPSDIRTVEAQVDQYNFLDIDDIEEFNGYLYQDKRTSKEKARMWALQDKSLQIINRHPELEKLEIRATIKRFLRFYSFLIQATCFESVDLHKKYNFLSYLVKEIEVGSGGNDFDIADKITASNFRQKKTGEKHTRLNPSRRSACRHPMRSSWTKP